MNFFKFKQQLDLILENNSANKALILSLNELSASIKVEFKNLAKTNNEEKIAVVIAKHASGRVLEDMEEQELFNPQFFKRNQPIGKAQVKNHMRQLKHLAKIVVYITEKFNELSAAAEKNEEKSTFSSRC